MNFRLSIAPSVYHSGINFKRIFVVFVASIYLFCALNLFSDLCEIFSDVAGYHCARIDYTTTLYFFLAALIPATFLPLNTRNVSAIILWIAYYTNVIPTVLLVPLLIENIDIFWYLLVFEISTLYLIASICSTKLKLQFSCYQTPWATYNIFILLIGFCLCTYLINLFGVPVSLPNIDDVYGVRADFVQNLQSSSDVLVGYLVVIGGYVLAPFSLILGFRNLNSNLLIGILLLFAAAVISVIIYSLSGLKSVAFASISAFFIYFICLRIKDFGFSLGIFIPIFVLFISFISSILGYDIFYQHWYRRVFMVPGMDSLYFIKYMRTFDLNYLVNAPEIISLYFFDTDGTANSGLFGYGYSLNKYIGIPLTIVLLIIINLFSDAISNHISPAVNIALFIPVAYAISNSALTSVFFTYGLFVIYLFYFIAPDKLRT